MPRRVTLIPFGNDHWSLIATVSWTKLVQIRDGTRPLRQKGHLLGSTVTLVLRKKQSDV